MHESIRPQVDHLVIELNKWREGKPYKHTRIPREFWDQILSLAPHCTIQELVGHFRLNRRNLRDRLKQAGIKPLSELRTPAVASSQVQKNEENPAIHFTQLQLSKPSVKNSVTVSCKRVEIKRSDGSRLRLYSHRDRPFEVNELINTFLKG